MQKESLLFFSFPNDSNFGEAKVKVMLRHNQHKACIFFFCQKVREALKIVNFTVIGRILRKKALTL